MISRILLAMIILLCISCESRLKLNKPVYLTYSNQDVEIDVKITHRSREKFEFGSQSWYLFYGNMTSKFISNKRPAEIRLKCDKKESQFYIDSVASTPNFRNRMWQENWTRRDKIYITCDNKEIEWGAVKFVEIESGKEFEHDFLMH